MREYRTLFWMMVGSGVVMITGCYFLIAAIVQKVSQ